MSSVVNDTRSRTTSTSSTTSACSARSRSGSRTSSTWWKEMGPAGFQAGRRLPAHGDQRRPRRLGALRLREDARLPLGHLPRRPGGRPHDRLRRRHGQAGVAGGAGRAPQHAAPPHRDPGRHRAGHRRAAAPARPDRALALRPAQPLPGQRRGGPPPLGDGLPAAHATSAATAARRPRSCSSAARGNADKPRILGAFNEPMRRLARRSSCSRCSPTATASTSCSRSPRAASTRSSRTTRFMLTEEAHHMFVGETGVLRVVAAHRRAR